MSPHNSRINRRHLLQSGAAAAAASRISFASAQTPQPPSDIAEETSITEIQHGYQNGDFSISEFVDASLNRISTLDGESTWLQAMIETNPDALEIAQQLDEELKAGNNRGPLHGVPVVVKDVFATADKMQTTAGSRAMEGTIATRDAFVVQRMREAGMVILGKSNLTEWSGFRPVLYGWSPRGGLSVNPYATSQTTWGSSSGSAAAVAASYVPVSLGVETDGSILCPASACGVVGIKPTVGVTSRRGAIGNGYTLDSPGVMGRSVYDAALLLSAIAGLDPEDPAYGDHAEFFPAGTDYADRVHQPGARDYGRAIADGGLDGARIGVVRSFFGIDSEADRHAENALLAMKEAGAELVDDIYPEALAELQSGYIAGETMGVEFPVLFDEFLRDYAPDGPIQSLWDVTAWYDANPDESNWAWENDALSLALWPHPEWGEMHVEWMNMIHEPARARGIDHILAEYEVDALVSPTCAIATSWDNNGYFWSSSQMAASAGYPSITIPIGYSESMPAGLHFFGGAYTERRLIRFAAELERTLQVRQAPQYLEYTAYDEKFAPPQ